MGYCLLHFISSAVNKIQFHSIPSVSVSHWQATFFWYFWRWRSKPKAKHSQRIHNSHGILVSRLICSNVRNVHFVFCCIPTEWHKRRKLKPNDFVKSHFWSRYIHSDINFICLSLPNKRKCINNEELEIRKLNDFESSRVRMALTTTVCCYLIILLLQLTQRPPNLAERLRHQSHGIYYMAIKNLGGKRGPTSIQAK